MMTLWILPDKYTSGHFTFIIHSRVESMSQAYLMLVSDPLRDLTILLFRRLLLQTCHHFIYT